MARSGRRCREQRYREVAQLGSAPALGAGGRGFKSPLPDHVVFTDDRMPKSTKAVGTASATYRKEQPTGWCFTPDTKDDSDHWAGPVGMC
jgi:hypothetical protein